MVVKRPLPSKTAGRGQALDHPARHQHEDQRDPREQDRRRGCVMRQRSIPEDPNLCWQDHAVGRR